MQTIVKLEPRVEVTPSGAERVVYRKREIRPTDPGYAKELLEQKAYFYKKSKEPLKLMPKDPDAT